MNRSFDLYNYYRYSVNWMLITALKVNKSPDYLFINFFRSDIK